jgi:hypothetical protein
VLLPTNTNFATAAAALHAGATIRLYDSGLYPNPDDIAGHLTSDVAAVVVVYIGGYISPSLPEIVRLCADHEVPVVETPLTRTARHCTAAPPEASVTQQPSFSSPPNPSPAAKRSHRHWGSAPGCAGTLLP